MSIAEIHGKISSSGSNLSDRLEDRQPSDSREKGRMRKNRSYVMSILMLAGILVVAGCHPHGVQKAFMNVKNRSKTITAKLTLPKGGAKGVILAQGGRFGGWCLYMKDGKPVYTYDYLGLERFTVTSTRAVPAGAATVVMDFVYDGGGLGKGGMARLSVNGETLAKGRIDKTQPLIFSADETR